MYVYLFGFDFAAAATGVQRVQLCLQPLALPLQLGRAGFVTLCSFHDAVNGISTVSAVRAISVVSADSGNPSSPADEKEPGIGCVKLCQPRTRN